MALADHLGLSSMTEDEWKILARERAPTITQGDLFVARPLAIQVATSTASAIPAERSADAPPAVEPVSPPANASDTAPPARTQVEPQGSGWIGRDLAGWLNR
jgi:hypothetical protein